MIKKLYFIFAIITTLAVLPMKNANAAFGICPCGDPLAIAETKLHPDTNQHISDGFEDFRDWMTGVVFAQHILPDLKSMTAQIALVTKQQELQTAKILDGYHAKKEAGVIHAAMASAHHEFKTSKSLCKIATQSRSLNASEQNVDLTTAALVSFVDQSTQGRGDAVAKSQDAQAAARFAHYLGNYVNCDDNGGGARNSTNKCASRADANGNIDFYGTFMQPKTINVDYSDGKPSKDKERHMAVLSNLFPSNAMHIPASFLVDGNGNRKPGAAAVIMAQRGNYVGRSLAATAIIKTAIAPKTAGTGEVSENYHAAQVESGLTRQQSEEAHNDADPSYSAQRENLSGGADAVTLAAESPNNAARIKTAADGMAVRALYEKHESANMQELVVLKLLANRIQEENAKFTNEVNQLTQTGVTASNTNATSANTGSTL